MKGFSKVIVAGALPAVLAGTLRAEPAAGPATQADLSANSATQPAAQAATQPATGPAVAVMPSAAGPDGSLVLPDGTSKQNPGPAGVPMLNGRPMAIRGLRQ